MSVQVRPWAPFISLNNRNAEGQALCAPIFPVEQKRGAKLASLFPNLISIRLGCFVIVGIALSVEHVVRAIV
jgi:hypothetical protein